MNSSTSEILAQLRSQFASQLNARLAEIRAHYEQIKLAAWKLGEVEAVHRLVHGLTGSAGTFGMMSVSEAARQMEILLATLIKRGQVPTAVEWQAIASALDRLEKLAHIRLATNAPSLTPPKVAPRLDRSPLIYMVEDDAAQAAHLRQALMEDGYRVKVFTKLSEFRAVCTALGAESPAAILMDMIFPEGDSAGAKLLAELAAQQGVCPPVIFVSVRDDLAARLAAFRAGACRYMTKPVDARRLIGLLDEITGRQPFQPYRVLLVDDDSLLLEAQAAVLRAGGMEVLTLLEPLNVIDAVDSFAPEVVVLDVYMPEVSGPELAVVLRERDENAHLPILFLSAETDMNQQLLALNLGGDDFLVKPVQADHFIAAVSTRARRARQNNAMRKRLETTLYEREREHLALDQHAIVSITDVAGNITYVNDKLVAISGYTREELLGQNHRILKSGEHEPEFYRDLWRTIASGGVWQGEICNRRKGGDLYWVASTITPFLDSVGKPYQYVSIRTDITHVKAAEAALRESTLQLNEAQAMAHLGNWQVNMVTGEATWSDEVYRIFGHSKDIFKPSSQAFFDAVLAEDLPQILACGEQAELHGYADVVHRMTRADGAIIYVHQRMRPLKDATGKQIGFCGTVQDVTDLALAEQAMEASEERLRRGQNFANIGTWDWNIKTGELYWTERIAPLFGYPVSELETSYENFLAAVHPDDRQAVIDAVNACVERDAPYEIEHRVVWPDDSVHWLLERGAVMRDAEGNPVQMLGVVQDIHERKMAEAALAESESRFRNAFETSSIGMALVSLEGRWLRVNPAFCRIVEYSDTELLRTDFQTITHPLDLNADLAMVGKLVRNEISSYQIEKRYYAKSGRVVWVLLDVSLVRDSAGIPVHFVSQIQDVTERKAVEAQLIAARDEADRANQAKSEFLSSMSHELRTPMNAILGFGQLMEYDQTLSSEQRDNTTEIIKAGRHLLELINDVLDLAKVESGHIDLSLEAVEINALVEECLSLVGAIAGKRDIQLSYVGLPGAAVRADRTRLRQVMLNLLSNAIKYNRQGGRVKVELQQKDANHLRIQVVDTGQGIPAERLQELFKPFNRLGAETTEIEGTGIGLTITRRIIELMGGIVDVDSEVGVGSTFWIELPLETLSALQEKETAIVDDAPMQHGKKAQHTVLYIEDNPANIKLMAQILGLREHIHLLTAHAPELGIELARVRHPDLILLDINMPGMNGYQVLAKFKADPDVKAIPVIAVTANAMPRDIERGMAAGFTDYFTKPLDIERLHSVLDACLEASSILPQPESKDGQ